MGLILSILTIYFLRGVWNSDNVSVAEHGPNIDSQSTSYSNNSIQESDFNRLVNAGTSITELRFLSEFLGTLDEPRLLDLITFSATQEFSRRLNSIQTMLFEYLVQLSPEDALDSVWLFDEHRRAALLKTVFSNWSKFEMHKSLDAATGLNPPYRELAIEAILAGGSSLSNEDLISLTSKEHVELGLSKQEHVRVVYDLLDQQPRKAFDLLVNDDIEDFEQADLFRQVVDRLFQVEGLGVIATLHNSGVNRGLKNQLFFEVADRDRAGALTFLQNIPSHEQISIVFPLMEHWVSLDADEALAEVRDLPESYFRTSILDTLLSQWALVNPVQVLDRLAEFPRKLRSQAALNAFRELTSTDPTEALGRLSSLRTIPGVVNVETELVFVRTWSKKDPSKAVAWVQSNVEVDSLKRARMLRWILPELALSDTEKAMNVALSEKPHSFYGTTGLDYMIVESLVRADRLESAIDILDQIRNEARSLSYAVVGAELVIKDQFDEAISLSEKIPPLDRVSYFRSMMSKLQSNNSSSILTLLAKIPDAGLRSDVVNQLLNDDWTTDRYYTEEQLETLRSLVAE